MRVAVLHAADRVRPRRRRDARRGAGPRADAAGHEAELVHDRRQVVPGDRARAPDGRVAELRHHRVERSEGRRGDRAEVPRLPRAHERKIVWLIHQHRTAYELWDHPEYADLSRQEDGAAVRDMVWTRRPARAGRGQARVHELAEREGPAVELDPDPGSEVLYHPSPVEDALPMAPGSLGDHILFPSRMEGLKRQSLVVEAMQHMKTRRDARARRAGRRAGAARSGRRTRACDRRSVRDRCPATSGCTSCTGALAVYYGPFDEDYGYVTLEGFAARPAGGHALRRGGPLEFVTDGETGLVVPPEPKAIAEAFDRLFADRTLAKRLGTAGNACGEPRSRAGRTSSPGCWTDGCGGSPCARGGGRAATLAPAPRVGRDQRPRMVFLASAAAGEDRDRDLRRAVLDGLRRIGFFERPRHGRPVADRAPKHEASARGTGWASTSSATTSEFHREIYRAAFLPGAGLIVLHDLALDDFVRGMKTRRRSARLHGRRARPRRAARANLHVARRRSQRAAARAVVRARRSARPRDHRALRILQAIPRGVRVSDAGVRRARIPSSSADADVRRAEAHAPVRCARRLEARGMRTLVVAAGDLNQAKRLERGARRGRPAGRRRARRARRPADRGIRRRSRRRGKRGSAIA